MYFKQSLQDTKDGFKTLRPKVQLCSSYCRSAQKSLRTRHCQTALKVTKSNQQNQSHGEDATPCQFLGLQRFSSYWHGRQFNLLRKNPCRLQHCSPICNPTNLHQFTNFYWLEVSTQSDRKVQWTIMQVHPPHTNFLIYEISNASWNLAIDPKHENCCQFLGIWWLWPFP